MDRFIGKKLDGRYELREVIGIGGMAIVYKAYDSIEDRIVAVKILKEEFCSNADFIRRFKNESKAIAMLSHPNIVKVFDVSIGDLLQYIVMEYIDGITLKEYIEQQGKLTWKETVHFTAQILKGLGHAHDKGIVHRDVKPQNIILLPDGTIKVTDFGIARFARSEHKTLTDKAIGSVHYISPEQARGETTDEKADIYSVGVMMYEMLTGSLPFQAESAVSVAIMHLQTIPKLPSELNPEIPLGLEQITMHAMQKDVHRRYASAAEMLRNLEEFRRDPEITFDYTYFVDDEPTQVNKVDDVDEDETKDKKKFPVISVLAGIAGALVLALIMFLVLKQTGGSSSTLTVACPNFVGMTKSQIEKNDDYSDLNILWRDGEYNSKYKAGTVMSQNPKSGRTIKKSEKITLTVSLGEKKAIIPESIIGMTYNDAKSALEEAGFTNINREEVYEESDENKDLVVVVDPALNSSVSVDSKITLTISLGTEVVNITMINVINLNLPTAKSKLEALNLKVVAQDTSGSKVDVTDSGYTVTSQSVQANEEVAEETQITLTVKKSEYTYSLKISVPSDVTTSTVKLKAFIDGVKFSEPQELLVSDKNNYTFDLTSTKDSATVKIQIACGNSAFVDYQTYTVNFKNSTQTLVSKSQEYLTVQ